jgi:hypothetical protein
VNPGLLASENLCFARNCVPSSGVVQANATMGYELQADFGTIEFFFGAG